MTGRRLSITIEPESYFLDIPDYSMSCDEIDALIREKIEERLQEDLELDADWEWVGTEPKSKEQNPVPSEEAWLDVNGDLWATTGIWAIRKDFFTPIKMSGYRFLPASDNLIEKLKEMVSTHSANLPCHPGLFDNRFKPILEASNVNVTGRGVLEPAWVEKGGVLAAIVMPAASIRLEDLSQDLFSLSEKS
jgi:hypothetical protein